jgi:hypothetical protein
VIDPVADPGDQTVPTAGTDHVEPVQATSAVSTHPSWLFHSRASCRFTRKTQEVVTFYCDGKLQKIHVNPMKVWSFR